MTMKHLNLQAKKLQTVSVRKALCTWTQYLLESHVNVRAQWKHGHGLEFKIDKHW